MKKKIELGTVIFIVVVAVILASIATYMYLTSLLPSLASKENFYDRLSQVMNVVDQRYIGDTDDESAMNALIKGYVTGIDKYSTYLDSESYAEYEAQLNGNYSGIGITVKYVSSTGLLKVIEVKSNSPASEARIKKGDIIYKINGNLVTDLGYDDSVSMLKEEIGKTINITVLRDEEYIDKTVTVSKYLTSSVDSDLLYDNVGYISVSEFDNTTADDFISSVEALEKKGAEKFIFDMRNNVGGSLSSVVSILDYLLPEGDLVTLEGNEGKEKPLTSDAEFLDKEFVVLINGSTYSGGELFAAAVRDFKAGKIIGETTYGKGYAQEVIPLNGGRDGALYLSTKLYYPPSGENYEGVGVSPDIEVKLTPELEDRFYELTTEEDLQLCAALEQLGKTIENEDEKDSVSE